jgi:hypothetical protein
MTDADTARQSGSGTERQEDAAPVPEEAAPVPEDAAAGQAGPWAPPTATTTESGAPVGAPLPHPYPSYPSFAELPPSDGRPVLPGTNGLAIAALVTGLVGCLWPVALGLGIGALVQLGRRQQRGRGLAVTGTVLGLLGMTVMAIGLVVGSVSSHVSEPDDGTSTTTTTATAQPGSPTGPFALQPGDCFTSEQSGTRVHRARTDCAKPHYGEVFFTAPLPGHYYPGVDEVRRQADKLCAGALPEYLTDPWAVAGSTQSRYLYPRDEAEWEHSGHTAICFLHDKSSGSSTGSLRLDSSNLTKDQQYLLEALKPLETQERALTASAADPAAVSGAAAHAVQGIQQSLDLLHASQWSAAAAGPMATLASTLQTDQAAWQAVGAASDPVGAYQQAVRDDNPLPAEVAARRALSLIDHDLSPADGSSAGTSPDDSAAADSV